MGGAGSKDKMKSSLVYFENFVTPQTSSRNNNNSPRRSSHFNNMVNVKPIPERSEYTTEMK